MSNSYCRLCDVLLWEENWATSRLKRNDKICNTCNSERAKQWRNNNKDKVKEAGKRRGKYIMFERYGITPTEWQTLFEAQGECCAICKSKDAKGNHGTFHIDHCHSTGNIRGLLCDTCNRGLGLFYDNKEILLKAIEYLEEADEDN